VDADSIGLVMAAIVAVAAGVVVAIRTGPMDSTVTAVSRSTPPQAVVAECNRVAADMSSPEKQRNEKIVIAAKNAGVHDERYRSAYVGCMKSRGYTS
jgi:hypothetical protein